jgi:peptidoglycan hydrolase CwlO-like protein
MRIFILQKAAHVLFRLSLFKNGNISISKQYTSNNVGQGGAKTFLVIEDNIPFPEEFTDTIMTLIPKDQHNSAYGMLIGEIETRFEVLKKMKEGLSKLHNTVQNYKDGLSKLHNTIQNYKDQMINMNQEIETLKHTIHVRTYNEETHEPYRIR